MYESERAVHEYLQFHFDPTIVRGPARQAAGVEGLDSALRFAQRVAERVVAHALPSLLHGFGWQRKKRSL